MKLATLALALSGCTSLGPMPSTTGVSAIPAGRPGFEAQGGFVPGFYLSQAAHEPKGAPIAQLSALLEPDRWLGVPGLLVGARIYGPAHDTYLEPYLGYRRRLGDRLALAAVAFGTANRATEKLASYHGKRGGAEAVADVQLVRATRWLTLDAQAAASATWISASGTYCADAMGVGVDCDTTTPANNTMVDGSLSGVYVAGNGGIALDAGRLSDGMFHSARLAAIVGAGTMPRVRGGMQQGADSYATFGLTLTLGLGAP